MFDMSRKPGVTAASAAGVGSDAETAPIDGGARSVSADEHDPLTSARAGADKALEEGGGSAASYAQLGAAADQKTAEAEAVKAEFSPLGNVLFCVILALAGVYMAPVLTNWVADPSDVEASRTSPAAMWVNIASEWATIILFAWTLVAPFFCSSRDFTH